MPLTFDFLGELDTLRVGEWSTLVLNVANVEHLTYELDHRLRLVERRRRHCNQAHMYITLKGAQ